MGLYVDNNSLKVSFTKLVETEAKPIEIQIISLIGSVQTVKVLTASEFKGNQVVLDISDLRHGVYNITVKSGDDITTGKFIK